MISFQLIYNIKSYKKYSDNSNSVFLRDAIIAIIVRSLKFLCLQYINCLRKKFRSYVLSVSAVHLVQFLLFFAAGCHAWLTLTLFYKLPNGSPIALFILATVATAKICIKFI